MNFRTASCSIVAGAVLASFSFAASAAPTVAFKNPANGGTLSGSFSNSSVCEVTGSNIRRVSFYLDSSALNTESSSPWNCSFDTRKFSDGTHTLRAVAYDSSNRTASAQVSVNIKNGTSTGGTTGSTTGSTTGGTTSGTTSGTAPTVVWNMPAEGGTLTGNVQGPPSCVVTGSNLAKVQFYINGTLTNTDGNLSNGLGCWIDTTKYKDGPYTLTAIGFNSAGQATAPVARGMVIKNGSGSTTSAPTVSFKQPVSGATITGPVSQSAACEVATANASQVAFKLVGSQGTTALNTDGSSPFQCAIDTSKFADGAYTLMAVASNSAGASATTQVALTLATKTVDPTPVPSGTGAIDAADLIGQANADVPFAQHSGYGGQVLGQYPSASSIPESGINGSTLSNGETVRLGKQADPTGGSHKALLFQLSPNDPTTSGSKRAEISYSPVIEMEKTYWAAFKVYVYDWGNISSSDSALFGTQLHSGDSAAGYSPSFGIYTSGSTGRNMKIQVRGTGLSGTLNYAEQPIPFGRWVDFVFKVRQSTGSTGFVQVWMDGNQIVNHSGPVGYKTSYKDYFKFGYYNWSGAFSSSRKVLLRSVTMVADPTGSKYDAATLRASINQ